MGLRINNIPKTNIPNTATNQSPSAPALTSEQISAGWYYGQFKDKVPGTPDTWKHKLEGTRGAKWYDPIKFPEK